MSIGEQVLPEDELVRLLAEVAAAAGGYGMLDHADLVAGALAVLRPGSEVPHVIRAAARLNLKDAVAAERILRSEALAMQPDSAIAKAHLGASVKMQGRAMESERVLNEVVAAGTDENAVGFARQLLAAR